MVSSPLLRLRGLDVARFYDLASFYDPVLAGFQGQIGVTVAQTHPPSTGKESYLHLLSWLPTMAAVEARIGARGITGFETR